MTERGNRLCAHADDNGEGMHVLAPGERCEWKRAEPSADECRPVDIVVDGAPETIRVHGGVPMDERDRAAMGELVAAVRAKVSAEHPHAGVMQELMTAWMAVRRQLPADDSRIGRNRNIAAVKQRMSDAIAAVRASLVATPAPATVTAEQLEAATTAVYEADYGDDHPHYENPPYTEDKPLLDNDYRRYEAMAKAAVEAVGLSVEGVDRGR